MELTSLVRGEVWKRWTELDGVASNSVWRAGMGGKERRLTSSLGNGNYWYGIGQ